MLNSLANHGYLPRNGKNVSIDQIVGGIDEALNLDPASSKPVAELAVTTSTTGNPSTLNLNDLNKHGGTTCYFSPVFFFFFWISNTKFQLLNMMAA